MHRRVVRFTPHFGPHFTENQISRLLTIGTFAMKRCQAELSMNVGSGSSKQCCLKAEIKGRELLSLLNEIVKPEQLAVA